MTPPNPYRARLCRRSPSVLQSLLDGNGHLQITTKRRNITDLNNPQVGDFTSGRINTSRSFNQTYGHFEARIKLPTGQGIWHAFWMIGSNFQRWGGAKAARSTCRSRRGMNPTIHGPDTKGTKVPTAVSPFPTVKGSPTTFTPIPSTGPRT
ncbi:family 16 glycosylhydrolase [Rhodococcus sp. NPDC049939]|uniref:family 16 glycosylhydrolase n=1 Tax=Rhodococcus sp. NPDC049939 TaxID=3155511 RepID=UPI0033DDB86D